MDDCCYRGGKLPKQNTKYIHKVKCRGDRLLSVSLTPCHCFLEFPSNFCMNGLLWPQSNHPWTGNVVAFLGSPRPRRDPHFPSVWLPSFTARVGCRFRLGHDLFPHLCFPPSLLPSPAPTRNSDLALEIPKPRDGGRDLTGELKGRMGSLYLSPIWALNKISLACCCQRESISLHAYIISHLHCLKTLPPKSIPWFPVRLPRPKVIRPFTLFCI